MSVQDHLPPLLEADRLTSILRVLAVTQAQWTTWCASDSTDVQALTRIEIDLRSQGALVKRIGQELWHFVLSEDDKDTKQSRLSTQPLKEIGQEQRLDLSEVGFSTADMSNATDLFIALRILKEALVLQLTYRCAKAGFVPLGPCLLSPLPELTEHSFDENLCLKPLPNGRYPGPQRQCIMSLHLAVSGDLTLALAKTDVQLIALDMHSKQLEAGDPVYLAPSGHKATLVEYSFELSSEAYRLQLTKLIGFQLLDTSRWVRVHLGDESFLWPSALTFVPYTALQVKPPPESWFGLKDTWLAQCKSDMERKVQKQKEMDANESTDNLMPDATVEPAVSEQRPASAQKPGSKDDSHHVYPTPPDATPGPFLKKASHDSDDEDMHVTDADFSFFDRNSPEVIMQEIESINHLPTPMETDMRTQAPVSAQPTEPPTASFDMITPASQFGATPNIVACEADKAAASVREVYRRYRQPVPSHFTPMSLAQQHNHYGPGGKYYAGSSASSADNAPSSDEEMTDDAYDRERATSSGHVKALLDDLVSEAEFDPPPPNIPWHLVSPRIASNPIKSTHLSLRSQLEKLALPTKEEADLIDLVGSLLCGPNIAGFRETSILPAASFNTDLYDLDWFSDSDMENVISCCKSTFGQAPMQLKLDDVATIYEDPKSSNAFKPKNSQRKNHPAGLASHVTLLREPRVLLSRAHIDEKTHKEIMEDYEMSTSAIRLWYTAQLSPLDGPKDAVHYVFYPEGELLEHAAFRYLDDLRALYYGCNLGQFLYEDKVEDSYLPFRLDDNSSSLSNGFNKIQKYWQKDTKTGHSAECLNIVLHFFNPFELSDLAFLSFLNMVTKYKKKSIFMHVALQVVDVDQVCKVDGFKALRIKECVALCLQVYNRCQLTATDSDPKLYAPAYQLAQPGIESLKKFHHTVEDYPSILDDGSPFHVAYACTPGQPWVTVAWSDSQGQAFRARQYRLRTDAAKPATASEYASIAAVFVDIWHHTMELISVFPIAWHLVVTKVGKRISLDEINAWLRMVALEKGKNKFRISVTSIDLEPAMLVQPPLLAYLQKIAREEHDALQGMTEEQQKEHILERIKPQTPKDEPLATALERPIGDFDDPSEKVFAIKLSKFQIGPSNLADPQPLASAYLVKAPGLNVTQSASSVLLSVFHLDGRCSVDELLQEMRNLATLAHVGGFTYQGGIVPRHIMHAAMMHTSLNGYKP
ncbi:mediator complex subunit 13 C-terminal-domain-containing protein [Protomyces lactucae-debilis]|uniref:Mediator of RNA polymerase II transcription subunit 13 n=1 Tax=Protomyces lactucae-debilis TaxID=2754530 RepID=A0A1Y2EUY2_PROLT|nr:mediator complex subunit 13 C-terminal-domain-containing protein [Protomyces lactucae-debilis]ORY75411.1 mediator complex subunit 13 C-terminal-domain-containing protein [Protomyces lactucae-debilis]